MVTIKQVQQSLEYNSPIEIDNYIISLYQDTETDVSVFHTDTETNSRFYINSLNPVVICDEINKQLFPEEEISVEKEVTSNFKYYVDFIEEPVSYDVKQLSIKDEINHLKNKYRMSNNDFSYSVIKKDFSGDTIRVWSDNKVFLTKVYNKFGKQFSTNLPNFTWIEIKRTDVSTLSMQTACGICGAINYLYYMDNDVARTTPALQLDTHIRTMFNSWKKLLLEYGFICEIKNNQVITFNKNINNSYRGENNMKCIKSGLRKQDVILKDNYQELVDSVVACVKDGITNIQVRITDDGWLELFGEEPTRITNSCKLIKSGYDRNKNSMNKLYNSKQIKSDYNDEEYWYPETKKIYRVKAYPTRGGQGYHRDYDTREEAEYYCPKNNGRWRYNVEEVEIPVQSSRKSIKSATDEELKYMRKNYPQSINESDYQKVVDKLNSLPECSECNFFYYEEPNGSYTIADKNESLDISEYNYTTRMIRKTLMDMGYFLEPVHTFQDFTLSLM